MVRLPGGWQFLGEKDYEHTVNSAVAIRELLSLTAGS